MKPAHEAMFGQGRQFLMRKEWPRMVWEVYDLTHFNQTDINSILALAENYTTTEVGGRYYMLSFGAFIDSDINPDDPELAQFMSKLFVEAATWWHDNSIQQQN